jgi:hypothetical protein
MSDMTLEEIALAAFNGGSSPKAGQGVSATYDPDGDTEHGQTWDIWDENDEWIGSVEI